MIEKQSDTWKAVTNYANERITALRGDIENPNTPEAARRDSVMRLDEIRSLLKQADPIKPLPVTTPVTY